MKTAHWQWLGGEVMVPGHEQPMRIGKKNLINNFCISVTGNYAACTKCHAGYGWSDATFDFGKAENVDCLVCHERTGAYVKGDSGIPTKESDLLAAARSVGFPKRENCSVCHSYGGGGQGVKHGDLDSSLENPSGEDDVHMGAHGFLCIDCHRTTKHSISGRAFSVSVEDANGIGCTDCHQKPPHADQRINAHLASVACQTCHIPTYARKLPTKTFWDWSKAGDPDREEDPHHYLKIKGEFVYGQDIVPEYMWFNRSVDRYLLGDAIDSTQVTDINRPRGDIHDPGAKIWPFKVHRALQPFDRKNNDPHAPGHGRRRRILEDVQLGPVDETRRSGLGHRVQRLLWVREDGDVLAPLAHGLSEGKGAPMQRLPRGALAHGLGGARVRRGSDPHGRPAMIRTTAALLLALLAPISSAGFRRAPGAGGQAGLRRRLRRRGRNRTRCTPPSSCWMRPALRPWHPAGPHPRRPPAGPATTPSTSTRTTITGPTACGRPASNATSRADSFPAIRRPTTRPGSSVARRSGSPRPATRTAPPATGSSTRDRIPCPFPPTSDPGPTLLRRKTYDLTLNTGAIISSQDVAGSYLNLQAKAGRTYPWDVHARRLVACVDCHYAPNNPAKAEVKHAKLDFLVEDPRRIPLSKFLHEPDHRFAAASCRSCHDPLQAHDFLPYKKRHFDALECQACHVPHPMGPAARMIDATVITTDRRPLVEYRGHGADGRTSRSTRHTPRGTRRSSSPTAVPTARPGWLRSTWSTPGSGPTVRTAPRSRQTWSPRPISRTIATIPQVLAAFDADQDGRLSPAELRLDTAAKTDLVRSRLRALGVSDPRIRREVSFHPISHGVQAGEQVQRDCASCHAERSPV